MNKFILAAALSCIASAPQAPIPGNASASEKQAENVTIIRDDWGIPHVYGKTDADASPTRAPRRGTSTSTRR